MWRCVEVFSSQASTPTPGLWKGLSDKTLILESEDHQSGKICCFQTEMLEIPRVVSVSLLFCSEHTPHKCYHYQVITEKRCYGFFFGLANVTTLPFSFFYLSFCYNAGTFESCFKCLIEWLWELRKWPLGSTRQCHVPPLGGLLLVSLTRGRQARCARWLPSN